MVEKKKKKDEELFTETLDETITQQPQQETVDNDYYKLAKDKEYRLLLDKEIQLENAKSNAMKYTNQDMSGYQSQGYGASQQTSILNNFLNALGSAQNQTSENISNLNQQEITYKQNEAANRINTFNSLLANATDENEIKDLFVDYNFGTLDENGNLVFNEKPENMTDDQWLQTKAMYRNATKRIDNETNSPVMYSLQEMRTQSYLRNNGEVAKISGNREERGFVGETERLYQNAENGVYKDGDVIRLENHQGEEFFVEYHDGGFRFVNKKVYNKATTKHTIKGKIEGDFKKGKVVITEN